MRRIFNLIENIAFWGIFWSLVLVIGFHIKPQMIWNEAISGSGQLRYICIYLISSFVVFPVCFIISLILWKRNQSTLIDGIFTVIYVQFNMPNRANDAMHDISLMKAKGRPSKDIMKARLEMVWSFFVTIVWYVIPLWTIYVLLSSDNQIIRAIKVMPGKTIYITIVAVVGIIILGIIVSYLLFDLSFTIVAPKIAREIREAAYIQTINELYNKSSYSEDDSDLE